MITIDRFKPNFEHLENIDIPNGSINNIKQGLLIFGVDRKKATHERPVLILHKYQEKSLVLPCTSQEQKNSNDFFELDGLIDIFWKNPKKRRHEKTYVFWQYENIDNEYIRQESYMGTLYHPGRLRLLAWWSDRLKYSGKR